MRNLTVTRQKSSVGAMMPLTVCIADPQGDLTIAGTRCRELGMLRNGETATYQIGEEETRVFVIADKLSKGMFSDSRAIPAGSEDVAVSGENHYNPFTGNPFRFEGEADEIAKSQRKKGSRAAIIVMVVAVLVGVGIGVGRFFLQNRDQVEQMDAKEYEIGEMSITLTEGFTKEADEDADAFFTSQDIALWVYRYDYTDYPNFVSMNASEFSELVRASLEMPDLPITDEQNGLIGFSFTDTVDGEDMTYREMVFKTDTAMWHLEFAGYSSANDRLASYVQTWGESVTFTPSAETN